MLSAPLNWCCLLCVCWGGLPQSPWLMSHTYNSIWGTWLIAKINGCISKARQWQLNQEAADLILGGRFFMDKYLKRHRNWWHICIYLDGSLAVPERCWARVCKTLVLQKWTFSFVNGAHLRGSHRLSWSNTGKCTDLL